MDENGIMVVIKGFHNVGSLQKITPGDPEQNIHGLFSTSGWAIASQRLEKLEELAIVRNGPADASFFCGKIEAIIPIGFQDLRGCERYVIIARYDPSVFVCKSKVPHANDLGYYCTNDKSVYLN
ncbi:hypothetical protein N9Y42_01860 [Mariniblastus sp.]|nr:hypothetical protein [Mariniblastus sp.]